MTLNEFLLDTKTAIKNGFGKADTLLKMYNSLVAIMELHQPKEIQNKEFIYCEGCSNSKFFPWNSCPTIQAIEKELR